MLLFVLLSTALNKAQAAEAEALEPLSLSFLEFLGETFSDEESSLDMLLESGPFIDQALDEPAALTEESDANGV